MQENAGQKPVSQGYLFGLATLYSISFFIVIAPFVCMFHAGGSSEAREMHITQIIASTGEWILPMRHGFVPSKPPLFHWLAALLVQHTPFDAEDATRLVSLWAASLVLWMTVVFAVRYGPRREPHGRAVQTRVGFLAAFFLGLSYSFLRMAGDARVDMLFSLFVCAACFPILAGCIESFRDNIQLEKSLTSSRLSAFFICTGFAVLSKGPLGIILPSLIAFGMVCSVVSFRRGLSIFVQPRIGWIYFFLIALPWYLLAIHAGSSQFVGRQLIFENIDRFFGGDGVNAQPIWFYLPAFLASMVPWSILLIYLAGKELFSNRQFRIVSYGLPQDDGWKLRRLPLIWLASGLILFSFASGKRDSYLLPLLPAGALYLTWGFEKFWMEGSIRLKQNVNFFLKVARIFFIAIIALIFIAAQYLRFPLDTGSVMLNYTWIYLANWRWLIELTGAGFLLVLAAMELSQKPRTSWLNFEVWFACMSAVGMIAFLGIGIKNELKGFYEAAQAIRKLSAGEELSLVRERNEEHFDPLLFYLARDVSISDPPAHLERCHGLMIARPPNFEAAQKKFSTDKMEILFRHSQVPDMEIGRNNRDIILYRCTPSRPSY